MRAILFLGVSMMVGVAVASAAGPIEAARLTPIPASAPSQACGNPVSRVALSSRPDLCPRPLGLTLIAHDKRPQRA